MMRRHELDPVSLTFGFAFTGLGLLFLLGRADEAFRLRWVWPILLLVLGVGILADLARHRDPSEAEPALEPPAAPAPDPRMDADLEPGTDPDVEPEAVVDNRERPI